MLKNVLCYVFGPNMTLMMFIWKMDWFKIVFFKNDFWSKVVFGKDNFHVSFQKNYHVFFEFKKNLVKSQSFVKTTFTSDFKKIYLKVVFCKDNFHLFFKFKKNLDKNDFESQVVFLKDDFHGKNRFSERQFWISLFFK